MLLMPDHLAVHCYVSGMQMHAYEYGGDPAISSYFLNMSVLLASRSLAGRRSHGDERPDRGYGAA